jgi:hypothetical protein
LTRKFRKQAAPDGSLHFGEAPVRSKTLMQPTKPMRSLLFMSSVIRLTVVFETPCPFPQLAVICGEHAALSAGGQDFVLAKGESSNIAQASDRSPLVRRTMRLSAIFDYLEAMFAG